MWNSTEAADEWGPLPGGTYRALVVDGELATSKIKQTPSFKLKLEVIEPAAHAGRKLLHDLWLTARALPMTKRDLAKLRIHRPEQLRQSPPTGMIVEVKVALREQDDGTQFNKVIAFKVLDEGTDDGALDPEEDKNTDEPDRRDSGGFDWGDGMQKERPTR
jgi:hypothetical protein